MRRASMLLAVVASLCGCLAASTDGREAPPDRPRLEYEFDLVLPKLGEEARDCGVLVAMVPTEVADVALEATWAAQGPENEELRLRWVGEGGTDIVGRSPLRLDVEAISFGSAGESVMLAFARSAPGGVLEQPVEVRVSMNLVQGEHLRGDAFACPEVRSG